MRLENTTEHTIVLHGLVGKDKTQKSVTIPRGQMGPERKQNGVAECDDDLFAFLKDDVVGAALLDNGDLVAKSSAPATAVSTKSEDKTPDVKGQGGKQ